MKLHVHSGRLALKHYAGLLPTLEFVLLQTSLEIVEKERLRGCVLMCDLIPDLEFRGPRLHLRGRSKFELVLGGRQDWNRGGLA